MAIFYRYQQKKLYLYYQQNLKKEKRKEEDGNELINVKNVKRISTCCWSETLDRISHCEA
jgi:GTP cyclohydrolase I